MWELEGRVRQDRGSCVVCFFFFKQKTAYEMLRSLVGSEMCIRDRGMEMAMAGLPVIVAGKTHYAGKGFTIDSPTWQALSLIHI